MQILKKILLNELVKGSIILFIMINIFNFLNYVFHFSMARMLGPADYGVLTVLMSILYIFSLSSEAIQNIVTRYVSIYSFKRQTGKVKSILKKSLSKGIKISVLFFVGYILISLFLSSFLDIELPLILISGTFLFVIFLSPMARGVLQGRKNFKALGLNMILESGIKLFLAIVLVYFGLRVYGAMSGVIIGGVLSFFFAFFAMREVLESKEKEVEIKDVYFYSFNVFVAMLTIILVFSLDIIIARRFFSAEIAGKYAVASMLGKMIFLGVQPISKAMFPLASENHRKKKKIKLFRDSVKIILLLCGIALVFFALIPKIIIRILFGADYLDVSNILFYVGLAFTFLSFTNLIMLYKLSINKLKKPYFYFIFIVLEVVLLAMFHTSLLQFSLAFLVSNFVLFVFSLFS